MTDSKKEKKAAPKGRLKFYGLVSVAFALVVLIFVAEQSKEPVIPLEKPTLSIEALRPPAGSDCEAVRSGAAKGVYGPLVDEESAPCGLSFTVDAGKVAQFVALQVDTATGAFMKHAGKPKNLDGTRTFTGKLSWNVILPSPLSAPLNIDATILSSRTITKMDMKWIKARKYRKAAIDFVEQRGATVLRKKISIKP